MDWIKIKDQKPPTTEPVIYAKPDTLRGEGHWHVGIAYWSVGGTWNPDAQSEHAPAGFTHWKPLGSPPIA